MNIRTCEVENLKIIGTSDTLAAMHESIGGARAYGRGYSQLGTNERSE